MYLLINTTHDYACYTLTDVEGMLTHIGVCESPNIMAFPDLPNELRQANYYLSVIGSGDDRMKLAQQGLNYAATHGNETMKQRLIALVESWSKKSNSHAVKCVKTGKVYPSIAACARENNLDYSQLVRHLNGEKSYKTVKGNKYERTNK